MTDALRSGLETADFSTTIRPQDDLFRHVNGTWIDATEIPADKARWGSFLFLAEQAEKHVHAIIEEATDAPAGSLTRKIGDLYASFMDESAVEAAGASPLADQLARVDAVTDVASLLSLVGELDREGVASVLGLFVEPDPGDPDRYVPFLVQSAISLPDESYYRVDTFAEVRAAYVSHVERLLALAGVTEAADEARRVMAIETDVASHHWDNVRSRDAVATYNLKTWDDIVALAGVDLGPWLEAVAPGKTDAFAEAVVYQPSYVEALGGLLSEERLDDWRAWLRWRIIHAAAPYLSSGFVDENFAFYGTTLSGVPQNRERWKRGVSVTERALGDAIGQEYVARHFPPAAKDAMDTLVANLIEAYRVSIENLEWMGADTRRRALDKLAAFTPKIGYPATWREYDGLEIAPDDLLGNVLRSNVHEHDRQVAKVGTPIDRDEWLMTPQTVNAYYNPVMNEIVFPAAILQFPFFEADRDDAANYGGIGAVIGHEIGHGFDDQGSRYDGAGKLEDWWTDADRTAFEERTAALIAQYDALSPEGAPGQHVNGALTIGENIGDLGGLSIALAAYELSLAGERAAEIDGYTGVQRLLLSWGQIWREKSRPAEAVRLLTIDPHSPNEFRCNQIVRNIDAFYDAFSVGETDRLWLAPTQRVTIW